MVVHYPLTKCRPGLVLSQQVWLKGVWNKLLVSWEVMVKAVYTPHAAVLHSHPSLKHPWLDAWRRSMCKWRSWLGHCNFLVAFTQPGSSCIVRSGCCPEALLWIHCAFLLQCQPISAFLPSCFQWWECGSCSFCLCHSQKVAEHLGKIRVGQTVLFERCRNWGTFTVFSPSP